MRKLKVTELTEVVGGSNKHKENGEIMGAIIGASMGLSVGTYISDVVGSAFEKNMFITLLKMARK